MRQCVEEEQDRNRNVEPFGQFYDRIVDYSADDSHGRTRPARPERLWAGCEKDGSVRKDNEDVMHACVLREDELKGFRDQGSKVRGQVEQHESTRAQDEDELGLEERILRDCSNIPLSARQDGPEDQK